MKKRYLFWSLLFSSLCLFSCSGDDDDDLFPIPSVPGVDLQTGEIQLVFQATPENYEVAFEVEATANTLEINWGDTGETQTISNGEISYTYPPEDKTYIITIQSPSISRIDLTHEKTKNIIGFYAGECPDFMNLSFNKDNLFEAFDLKKCPQYQWLEMQVNKDNFDLSGLQNANYLALYLAADLDTNLKDFTSLEKLYIYPDLKPWRNYKPIRVENSPNLRILEMNSFSSSYYAYPPYTTHLQGLTINAPLLNRIYLSNQYIHSDINFQEAGKDSVEVILHSINSPNKLLLSPATRTIAIHNGWNPQTDFNIEELDLTSCKQLEYVQLDALSGLKAIHLGDASHLKRFWLQLCLGITEFEFDAYPQLVEIDIFGNDNLKTVKMSNLPALQNIAFHNNNVLSQISATNTPALSSIDFNHSTFDEETIISFLESIPDELSPKGQKRRIQLYNNPGYTEKVKAYIESHINWELYDPWISSINMRQSNNHPFTIDNDKVIHLKGNKY